MNPPAIGDEVRVFGFPNSSIAEGIVTVSPAECLARVREVSLKNSSPYRPTSYVELDGEMLGGMSGGPCFDKNWNVVGMVSKGIDFGEEPEESPICYMSLLWPAMSLPLDLYRTGPFPIWDLLKSGSLLPIGRRRLEVSSEGGVQFATVDPESLRRLPPKRFAPLLEGPLDFAMTNARRAMIDVRNVLANDNFIRQPEASNALYVAIRRFFWELDSALRIAIAIAAARLELELTSPVDWTQLENAWRGRTPASDVLDALVSLRFEWDGVDLFEIRAYSDRAKEGGLVVQSVTDASDRHVASILGQIRRDGAQVSLPDGLERFAEACGHFVRRLLGLSSLAGPPTTTSQHQVTDS
jgi:hypothetical protein